MNSRLAITKLAISKNMKNITKNWKHLKNLFWGGPILIVMGLSAGAIADTWIPVPLGLIIAGTVVIIAWAVLQSSGDVTNPGQQFWGRRAAQAGTNAFVATLAVVAILGIINFVAARNVVRVDLTENQVLTIAPQSQQLVRTFTVPVKVWAFNSNPNSQDVALLENYRRQNPRFSFEFVDPNAKPDLTQKFGVTAPGQVYLEYGEKRKFVQSLNEERLSEVKLTNALQQIKSDRIDKVYFLQGHGELPLQGAQDAISLAVQSLDEKNYKSEPLNLAERAQVPTDASVVAIARPKQALFEAEVNALRDYLRRGGSLLLMIDPNNNSGIDSLLQEWGVKLDNRLIINASSRQVQGFGPAAALVTQYGDHPITKDFGNNYSFYPFARPIEIVPTVGVDATPLVLTNEQSWAESNPENPELKFDPNSDRNGPLTLAVALSRKLNSTQTPQTSPSSNQPKTESRLVIIGNSTFATDALFGQQLNGDVFLNSIAWLSQRNDQTLSIRPKQANNRRINLTPQQFTVLAWTAVAIIPLIGLIAGGVLWWKRR